jgi:hypothetical protein
MFNVIRRSDRRMDVELEGRLNREDMKIALDSMISEAAGMQHARLLYRIGEFDLPTLGAMHVEISYLPELFRFARKFDRMAVIADQRWIRVISELEGALMPGLSIRAFTPDQEQAAEAWLSA